MLKIFSVLSILIILPINAMAANTNAKGAETLKKSFQSLLEYYKTSNEILGDINIIYNGEVKVAQETEYYTITLPSMKFKTQEVEDKTQNYTFNIGSIIINATPDDKAGYWKSVLTFPNNATLSNGIKEEEDITLSFKNQNTVALFNERLGYFTKLHMNLSDVYVKDNKDNLSINIGGLQIYSKLEEDESGDFSGPGYFTITNLNLNDKESDEILKLGEFKLDFKASGLTLPTIEEYLNKIIKHKETFESLTKLEEDGTSTDNINGDNVMDMVIDLYNFEMDSAEFQYSMKNLDISEYSDNDEKGVENFKIGSAFIGMGFDNLNSDSGNVNIKTGYSDMEMIPSPPEYNDIFPKNMNFNIKAENIPYTDLSKVVLTSAKSVAKNPSMATMAGMGLLMRLPAILSQAGTKIIFDKNGIKNDIYDIVIDGEIITDLAAMMNFSAQFKTVFNGLDELLAVTEKRLENKDNPYNVEMTDLTKTLKKLKEIGKSEKGSSGKNSYIFELKSTPDGKFMINDIDTSTISFE